MTTKTFIKILHKAMTRVSNVNDTVVFNTVGDRFKFIYDVLIECAFNLSKIQSNNCPKDKHYISAIIAVHYFLNITSLDCDDWLTHVLNLEKYNKELEKNLAKQ